MTPAFAGWISAAASTSAMPDGRMRSVTAAMLAIGALFPLTGATMLAALGGEWLWRRRAA